MKKYFIAALSLAALVACSKDELPVDPVLDSSQKSVSISIANMASDTRAAGGETTPATADTKASTTMDKVYILFADAAGKIIDVKSGLTGTGPFVFHKVSALATQVAAVGNVTTENTPEVGDYLSTYETLWKTEDVDAAYTDLVVYAEPDTMTRNGDATCTDEHTGETYPLYSASITIKPYMARIEISQISCTNFGGANVGYDAIGVTGMTLAGGDVTNSGDTSGKPYTFTLGSFASDTALMAGSTTDYVLKPVTTGDAEKLTADTDKVWSWNIVPQKVSNLTTGLYVSGDGYTTSVPVREVVINSYKTGSTDIESFAGGNIYQFAINFSYNNIEAVDDYLCANVTVSIDPWTIVPTEVGFKTPTNP